jgi:hypothetical protein
VDSVQSPVGEYRTTDLTAATTDHRCISVDSVQSVVKERRTSDLTAATTDHW